MNTLDPTQEQVLALISAGSTISAAAESAGLHRNTIHNWVRSHASFRLALARAREAKALYWREQAEQLASTALDTVRTVMTDPSLPASVRLKAAQFILNLATAPPLQSLPLEAVCERSNPVRTCPTFRPGLPDDPLPLHNSAQSTDSSDSVEQTAAPGDPLPLHNSAQPEQSNVATTDGSAPDGPLPFRRTTPKIGRNDLCPCGSGKKYKRCCLEKEAPAAA